MPVEKEAFRLLELARSMGVERGIDVVLRVLYVRWQALTGNVEDWAALARDAMAESVEHMVSDAVRLPIKETESSRSVLAAIISAVDEIGIDEITGIFETVLSGLTESGKLGGEFHTPASVARLLAALVVRPGAVVYDPACGTGNTLLAAHHLAKDLELVGTDVNDRAASRTDMRLRLHGLLPRIERREAFAFAENAPEFADAVLAQPPWGVQFDEKQKARFLDVWGRDIARGDVPWLFLAQYVLRPGGRAAVVLGQGSLFSRHAKVHSDLLDGDVIEAIIALPSGVFRSTGIKTAIWVLRREAQPPAAAGRILLIDAESLARTVGRRNLEFSPEAVDQVAGMVHRFRRTGTADSPPHVARVISRFDLDPARGLVPQAYLAEPPEEAVTHPTPDRSLLTEVRLTNFKSFGGDIRIPLAPLTLVYGANSAGKSSVLQALLLLKQSIGHRSLVTQGPVTDVGSFAGVLHRHTSKWVGLGFTYGTLPSWIPPGGTADPARLREVRWTFGDDGGRGALRGTEFRFGSLGLSLQVRDSETEDRFGVGIDDVAAVLNGIAGGGLLYPFETGTQERRIDAERVVRRLHERNAEELALRRDGLLATLEPVLDWSRGCRDLRGTWVAVPHLSPAWW